MRLFLCGVTSGASCAFEIATAPTVVPIRLAIVEGTRWLDTDTNDTSGHSLSSAINRVQ
jgi:hypothetical protein